MSADQPAKLLEVFSFFPGIDAGSVAQGTKDGGVLLTMAYADDVYGKIARMVVDFIAERVAAQQSRTQLRCDAAQTTAFVRYLNYASLRPMGAARPHAPLRVTPLPTLLSHVLLAFTEDYEKLAADDPSNPQLEVWANVLRVIDGSLDLRELGPRAILAKRAVRVVVRDLQAQGWLEVARVEKQRGVKMLRLTAPGRHARDAGKKLAAAVERRWRRRFGAAFVDGLRASLAAAATATDVELPYYLTGYGPGDGAITGGPYLPEEPGPPRIPPRGEEWPVVPRSSETGNEPLFALLSIALAAFAIDYERERLGDLRMASTLLQDIPDEGTPLQAVRHQRLAGSGRSTPERHLLVIVAKGKRGDETRLVYPTPKARRSRDSYPALVLEIERNWQARLGAKAMSQLRSQLEAVDEKLDKTLPAFPDTMLWFQKLHARNP